MNALFLILAGAAVAAPNEPALVSPLRLSRGQELVYQGVCTEECSRPGARFTRHYTLDTYILILDVQPRETKAAFLTISRLHGTQTTPSAPAVRLEIGKIDAGGRVSFAKRLKTLPHVPGAGPATLESSAFIELPKDALAVGTKWEADIDGEPAMRWSAAGIEHVGTRCVRLVGEQRGANWERAGHPSWKREDRIWIQSAGAYASKIERTILHRDEGGDTVQRTHTVMELQNSHNPVFHPGGTFKVRQALVERAVELIKIFDELTEFGEGALAIGFDGLLNRIDFSLRNAADTPYREALVALRRQVETVKSGERPAAMVATTTSREAAKPLVAGQPLPNATIVAFDGAEKLSLADLRGQPAMLVFFKGTSPTIDYVLRYVAAAEMRYGRRLRVVPLVVDDAAAVQTRCGHLRITMTCYSGGELHRTIAGETTPLTVIVDKSGIARTIASGWGGEYPNWFHKEIQKVLQP